MKDRSKSGASQVPALIAAALALAGAADLARGDEPQAPKSTPGVSALPAPANERVPAPAPAVAAAPLAPPATVSPPPAPPAPAPTPAVSAEETGAAWFARPRLVLTAGQGKTAYKLRFFGFLEADYYYDTTRSYDDSMSTSLVARTDDYDNTSGRTQFSLKSTRLGFGFDAPVIGSVAPTAVIEADFAGSQPSPPASSESTFFASPIFRVRHAYVKLQNPYVDVLMGHTFDVFGWQSYFDPSGLRNQLYSRNTQLRLSREFNSDGRVTFEVAASASRPVERDSGVPDGSGGVRVSFNGWQGIRTPGNERIVAMPMTFAVSGIVRQFKLNAYTPPPVQISNSAMGWGLSLDAFIPIIPAANFVDRGNRLALMCSYVKGTGIADLLGVTGGAVFPYLFNPAMTYPPPTYDANADPGLVTFDNHGLLHTIDWTAVRIGVQYYLPTTGRWIFSANYTQAHSGNLAQLYPTSGAARFNLQLHFADTSHYADAKLTYDVTPVVRVGLGGQYTNFVYVDGNSPHNLRIAASSIYLF